MRCIPHEAPIRPPAPPPHLARQRGSAGADSAAGGPRQPGPNRRTHPGPCGLDEPGQRLLVQSLAHVGGENFLEFLLDFLAEGQDRVTLGLLGAELGAGFEHVDLRLGVVPQLIRLALCLGDDGVRLLPGVGQDRGGLLICTVNAVLFDGRNKILNLKFHN